MTLTEQQIKHLAERFLCWRLPENFNPDGGISFKKTFNDHLPVPMKHEPTGTNLWGYGEAIDMVKWMIEGMPDAGPGDFPTKLPELPSLFDEQVLARAERRRAILDLMSSLLAELRNV